jgi:aconitate hydratase
MGETLCYKNTERTSRRGRACAGGEIGIRIDQPSHGRKQAPCLSQFEAQGHTRVGRRSPSPMLTIIRSRPVSRIPTTTATSDHDANYWDPLHAAGNGMPHVQTERFGRPDHPSRSDSHTHRRRHVMIASGRGLESPSRWGGGPSFLACPRVGERRLGGKTAAVGDAKDIISMCFILTTRGNVEPYRVHGTRRRTLSVPERATITNMGAELGSQLRFTRAMTDALRLSQGAGARGGMRELFPTPTRIRPHQRN